MNKYSEDTDITTREFILLGAMLLIMVLSIIGILSALSEIASSSVWDMLSVDKVLNAFEELVGRLIC